MLAVALEIPRVFRTKLILFSMLFSYTLLVFFHSFFFIHQIFVIRPCFYLIRCAYNKFPDVFRIGTFIDSTHMKL